MVKTSARRLSDEDVAHQICTRLEYDGQQFQLGQFVAILDGAVVTVGVSFEAVDETLMTLGVDRDRGLVIEVDEPVPDVIR